MNCHSVSEDNRKQKASKEKRGRKKTEYRRQETVEKEARRQNTEDGRQ
jgi:hypothetical protein